MYGNITVLVEVFVLKSRVKKNTNNQKWFKIVLILLTYKSFVLTNLKNNNSFFIEQTKLKILFFLLIKQFFKAKFWRNGCSFVPEQKECQFFCYFYCMNTFLVVLLKKQYFLSEWATLLNKKFIKIIILLNERLTEQTI